MCERETNQRFKTINMPPDHTDHTDHLFAETLSMHMRGEVAAAVAQYHKILQRDPKHADTLHHLGIAYQQLGKLEEATVWIERSLASNPLQPNALSNLGFCLNLLGRYHDAIVVCQEATRADVGNDAAWTNLGNAQRAIGKIELAQESYCKALELQPKDAICVYNLARIYYDQKAFEKAKELYERCLLFNGKVPEVHRNLSACLLRLRQPEAALKHIGLAINLQPDYAEAWNTQGNALVDLKRHEEALASYERSIELKPSYVQAWINRGLALNDLKRYEEALASYERAIELDPNDAEVWNSRGNTLNHLQRYVEALSSYDRSLQIRSDEPSAWSNRGVVLKHLERYEDALFSYEHAIKLAPDFAHAWCNRGVTLNDLKHHKEALASYDRAIELMQDYADAWFNRGVTLNDLKRHNEALASYDRALKLRPDYSDAWFNRGVTLTDLKRHKEALASYDRLVELKPNYAEAWCNRGVTLNDLKSYKEALASFARALELMPDCAEAWCNRGVTLYGLLCYEESLASFDRAIEIKPDYAEAHSNRGESLRELKQYEQALASFDEAIRLRPDFTNALANRGNVFFIINEYEQGEASLREAIRIDPNLLIAHNNLLLNSNYSETLSAKNILEDAKYYGALVTKTTTPKFTQWNTPGATEKLRIGFVSGDLMNHSVGYFIEGLITSLDKTQFEMYAFPTSSAKDDLTNRLLSFIDEWIPIYGISDFDAASIIHQKGIQILVDLSGHSKNNRLTVFAYKPAPVQISWLGLPMTTGVPEIDYVLGDSYALPQEFEKQFTETVWRLPESYLCFTPPDSLIEVGALPALRNGYLTFASFNNLSKVNNKVVEVWSNILKVLPSAKLLIKTNQLSDPNVSLQTKNRFSDHGVEADRLLFKTVLSAREEHLATYNDVDIALDTFPYPGVTTSVEANWMGVPVLALTGSSFLSATATSIANNVGLGDWVASDLGNYVNKAVGFASNLDRLAQLRGSLRVRVSESALFDSPRFAKNFGNALCLMWSRYLEKNVKDQ